MSGMNGDDTIIDGENPIEDGSEKTISLMGGVVRPEGLPEIDPEFKSMKGPSKFLGQGTLLLVLVFTIAAGSLWAMRVGQGDLRSSKKAKAVEAKVEKALAMLISPNSMSADDPLRPKNLKALFSDTDEIVALFLIDPTRQQVPAEYIKKNPFLMRQKQSVGPTPVQSAAAARPREDPIKKLKQELSKYQIQSIVQGARPVAFINGDFVQPGQALGSFKVIDIHDMVVVLEAEGQTFTLEMKQDFGGRQRGRRR